MGGVLCISHVAVFSWSLRGQSFGVYPSMKGLKKTFPKEKDEAARRLCEEIASQP